MSISETNIYIKANNAKNRNMKYITKLLFAMSTTIATYSYVCQSYTPLLHQQRQQHHRLPSMVKPQIKSLSELSRNHRIPIRWYRAKSNERVALTRTFATESDSGNDTITESSTTATSTTSTLESSSNELLRATQIDAQDALNTVGWSIPQADGDLTSEDPFVQMIDQSIQNDIGVSLDELLNPAKVVNLERDLYLYRTQLAVLTGAVTTSGTSSSQQQQTYTFLTTENCDNGGGGTEAEELRKVIKKKEADLMIERRSVFRNWLKNVFLIQAILSFGLSYVMASNSALLFGQYDWYMNPKYNMDISISVLGYWWWWLFVIPSLRSRRPKGFEKQALDIAFLASPIISLLAPIATKDTELIWYANFVVVAGAYGFAYVQDQQRDDSTNDDDDNDNASKQPEWLKFVYKSLDFGTGRERGARN